jgi:hypothetical protein
VAGDRRLRFHHLLHHYLPTTTTTISSSSSYGSAGQTHSLSVVLFKAFGCHARGRLPWRTRSGLGSVDIRKRRNG